MYMMLKNGEIFPGQAVPQAGVASDTLRCFCSCPLLSRTQQCVGSTGEGTVEIPWCSLVISQT